MLYNLFKKIDTLRLYLRIALPQITIKKIIVMLRYLFLVNILRKKIPWVVEFSITYNCQCKCKHCSVSNYLNNDRTNEELTTIQCKDLLVKIKNIGIPKVDFFGGEPLLRKDIIELSKFASGLGLFVSITTNAFAADRNLIKELKLAKVSYISISLDSINAEIHDTLRGINGLYQKVMDAVRYCHELKLPCIVSTYITRKDVVLDSNIETNLTRIISLSKRIEASGIRILFPIISGKWEGDNEKNFTQLEQKEVLDSLDNSFAFIEGAYCVKKGKKICQALIGKMFNISPYGDVQLCVTYSKSFGNIKKEELKYVLEYMYTHKIYMNNAGRNCCDSKALEK